MKRGLYFSNGVFLLGLLLLTSCRTMGGGAPALPKLAAGVEAPAPTARLTGVLTGDAACLRVGGNGTTVIIWPLAANARSSPGNGNVIVIWPRSATIQRGGGSRAAGINGVVIWPRSIGVGTPVRVGEPIELTGDMKDDVSGLAFDRPLPPGCTGRAFIAREFRPAPVDQ